ncbi:LCP family protein [bacterium]|nr:LCP family protein [bacterium]
MTVFQKVLNLAILGALLGGTLFLTFFSKPFQQERSETILIVGLDDAAGLPDTILLVALPPQGGAPRVLSIPRDTLMAMGTTGADRINHAWARGGEAGLKGVLGRLADIEIDRYIVISMSDLVGLVDRLGGVLVDVPTAMTYTDEAGGVKIDLGAGPQTLDGEGAVAFARFRGDALGDIGRVSRQQMLGHALLVAFKNATLPTQWNAARTLLTDAKTDIQFEEALVMIFRTRGERPLTEILPGWFHEYDPYWHPDMTKLNLWLRDALGANSP